MGSQTECEFTMTSRDEIEKLQRLVNSSGFPFQLRVAQEIRRVEQLAWSVISEEHPWNDPPTSRDGFIDLIIGQNTNHDLHRMVIECKRTRDADWVFLLPNTRDRGTHVRCMWASTSPQTFMNQLPCSPGIMISTWRRSPTSQNFAWLEVLAKAKGRC